MIRAWSRITGVHELVTWHGCAQLTDVTDFFCFVSCATVSFLCLFSKCIHLLTSYFQLQFFCNTIFLPHLALTHSSYIYSFFIFSYLFPYFLTCFHIFTSLFSLLLFISPSPVQSLYLAHFHSPPFLFAFPTLLFWFIYKAETQWPADPDVSLCSILCSVQHGTHHVTVSAAPAILFIHPLSLILLAFVPWMHTSFHWALVCVAWIWIYHSVEGLLQLNCPWQRQ